MRARFEDTGAGGFFSTPEGDSNLILRMKDDYDGAEPSGNSMAALGLLRLAHATASDDLRRSAERTLAAFSARAVTSGMPQMLVALMAFLDPPRQIVLAGPRDQAGPMLASIRSHFLPETAVFVLDEASRPVLAGFSPAFSAMQSVDGRLAAYVCQDFACRLPVTTVTELAALLQ
jgi:hypothetical protein